MKLKTKEVVTIPSIKVFREQLKYVLKLGSASVLRQSSYKTYQHIRFDTFN